MYRNIDNHIPIMIAYAMLEKLRNATRHNTTDICVDCPEGEVRLSTLLGHSELAGSGVTGLTIRVSHGGTLVLDGGEAYTHVQKLWVEGPVPAVIHTAHNARSYKGVSAGLRGQAIVLASVFPNLKGLYIKYVNYKVDWGGWATAAFGLREQVIWTYENIGRALEFPEDCKAELNGLISHYQTDPIGTLRFIREALQFGGKTRQFTWHIGYYDPDHVSLLASVKSTNTP